MTTSTRRGALPPWTGHLVGAVLVGLALALLYREMAGYTWAQLRRDLGAVSSAQVLLAFGLTALNYVVLTGYDSLAVRYAGVTLNRWRVALAAVVGYALAQGLGFPLTTGAPVRHRLYSSWGVPAESIGRIVAFYAATFWVGYGALAGTLFLLDPPDLPGFAGLSVPLLRAGGALALTALGLYVWRSVTGGPSPLSRWVDVPIPRPRLVLGQVGVGALDWLVASTVLWVLLPDFRGLGFGTFLGMYLLSHFLGVVSRVPGGLGVFEATFLALASAAGLDNSALLARLLVFRGIYYLVPLVTAVGALGVWEVAQRRQMVGSGARVAARISSWLVPHAAAGLTFALGAVLLLTGSIPLPPRLGPLRNVLPLGIIEVSHFLASLIGVGLLVLARGLQRKLDGAYHVTLGILIAAAVLTLGRDLPWVSVLPFLGAAGVLYASRAEFYRPTSLLAETFTPGWILSIGAVIGTSVWLGLFAFRSVDYSHDLWWRFAFGDDAPRFLRASVGASVALIAFVGARLIHPSSRPTVVPEQADLDELAPLVATADRIEANLVYLGDKEILVSPGGNAFLMFGTSGSSSVVMGDPVGDESEFEELLWTFRETTDRAGSTPVFYQVGPRFLPLYIDLGLVFYKLGESAVVPLHSFSMDGRDRADFRKGMNKAERAGATFEFVGPDSVRPLIPELRAVSDEWLETKGAREKRFSLGRFDEDYLARFPLAVVRSGGRVVAFANLWTTGTKREISVDLMRYSSDAPKGVMDALFGHVMLHARDEGYRYFALGMAPLSGMERRRLSPLWHRMGSALHEYGEYFYNFQGLRAYKEKFNPEWEPRYLAMPPKAGLPGVLTDLLSLVSGGLEGSVRR